MAADALGGPEDGIISRWVERVGSSTYAAYPGLNRQDLLDNSPDLVHSVAQALRQRQPKAREAPWTAFARQHDRVRRHEQMLLADLLCEYQILREEIWCASRRHLAGIPTDDVGGDIVQNLGTALYTLTVIEDGLVSDLQGNLVSVNQAGADILGLGDTTEALGSPEWFPACLQQYDLDGRPIPPENLPHLLERYYRAGTTQAGGEGLGPGLHITRKLVEAHGGRTWVESEVGKDSTFSFSLPVYTIDERT